MIVSQFPQSGNALLIKPKIINERGRYEKTNTLDWNTIYS